MEGESDLTLPGRQLLDPRPPPHDEGGMASVMNIYPPAARMGIPPRYSLTGGEGEDPGQGPLAGAEFKHGGPSSSTRWHETGGFLTPGWDEAGPVPTQG